MSSPSASPIAAPDASAASSGDAGSAPSPSADAGAGCEPPVCFYVSVQGSDSNPGTVADPVRTLDRARALVAAAIPGMTADIHVYLRGGSYPVSRTVVFEPTDGAPSPHTIHYEAYPGETPVLDGTFRLTGWSQSPSNPDVYWASAQGHSFRDVYIQGLRAPRARWPKASQHPGPALTYAWPNGWFYVADDPIFAALTGPGSSNSALNSTEMVIPDSWSFSRVRIAQLIENPEVAGQRILIPAAPDLQTQLCSKKPTGPYQGLSWASIQAAWAQVCNGVSVHTYSEPYKDYYAYTYWLESNLLFVTEPGEWFLDRDHERLYVFAPPGVKSAADMGMLDIEAPAGEKPGDGDVIVRIQGTATSPVTGLSFESLVFRGTNWLQPGAQGAIFWAPSVVQTPTLSGGVVTSIDPVSAPAALEMQYVDRVSVDRCLFRDLAADAVSFPDITGTEAGRLSITNSAFVAIGGSAIRVQGAAELRITGNLLREVGEANAGNAIEPQSLGDALIANNDVSSASGAGIQATCFGANSSQCKSILVYDNKVNRAITQLVDMGAIYTGWMSIDPKNPKPAYVIAGNLVTDIGPPSFYAQGWFGTNGIYLDEGSTWVTVAHNEVAGVGGNPFVVNAFGPNSNNNIYENQVDQASMNAAQARVETGKFCNPTYPPVMLTPAPGCDQPGFRPGQANDDPSVTPTGSMPNSPFAPGLPPASMALWKQFVSLP